MFHFKVVTDWIDEFLRTNLGEGWALWIEFILTGIALLAVYAVLALILIWAERKVCAFFQCRLGPTRVGPWGLFQAAERKIGLLDGKVKIEFKDDFEMTAEELLVIQ